MKKYLIILIFILAAFLRIYKLSDYPVGFLWDEAALGYNGYSILKTGKDEYGHFFPLIFKSFGDYKPGLYVYLTIPTIAVFGLNEFSVRLPSALAGLAMVILFYFLIKEVLDEKLAIVSSFLLAISPWHLNFSRGAWELNVMLFEIILGIYFLIKYLNSQKKFFYYFASLVFILSLFTYQGAKLLVPLVLFGFILFFRKEIKKVPFNQKTIFLLTVLAGFLIFNLITFTGGKAGRLKVMSIFSYPRSGEESEMFLKQDNFNKLFFNLFHSSPIFFARSILGRYFNHFSGRFLFFDGDWSNPRNGTIYHGVLYIIDFIFLSAGLGVLFSKKRNPFENFILYWLVISPLPAALTRDSISSVRAYSMVIPLVFIISLGVVYFLSFSKKQNPFIHYSLFIILYSLFFIRFLDLYFIHNKKITSESRLYGYKEMIDFVKDLVGEKEKVVITTKYGQPYIFWLFYTKYGPKNYQKQAFLKESPYGDVGEVEKIDNLEFRKINWPADRGIKNALFVGDEFELPIQDIVGQENIHFLKEIKFLNGKVAFRIVETK